MGVNRACTAGSTKGLPTIEKIHLFVFMIIYLFTENKKKWAANTWKRNEQEESEKKKKQVRAWSGAAWNSLRGRGKIISLSSLV